MLFATTTDYGFMGPLFILVLLVSFVWLIYMATCKPDVLMRLREQEEEMRRKRHERMKGLAGGGLKAGMAIFKIFRR